MSLKSKKNLAMGEVLMGTPGGSESERAASSLRLEVVLLNMDYLRPQVVPEAFQPHLPGSMPVGVIKTEIENPISNKAELLQL